MLRHSAIVVLAIISSLTSAYAQEIPVQDLTEEIKNSKTTDRVVILVYSNTEWLGNIQDGNYITHNIQGAGNDKFLVNCGDSNTISYSITTSSADLVEVYTLYQGNIVDYQTNSESGKIITSTISCIEINSIFENNTIYYTIPIIIAIVVAIFFIIKKKPISGPRKFRT